MVFSSYVCSIVSILLLLIATPCDADMIDKPTGINFSGQLRDLGLFGVGVRKKGPIKVYSVGMYCSEIVRETLSSVSRNGDKGKEALRALCKGAEENPTSFVLKMNFKVGAEKMAGAIADSIAPRHSVSSDVDGLKGLIYSGVSEKGAAVKGTVLQFDCSPESGVGVSVDGKVQGSIESSGLAKAFCRVYLDDDCVSKPLRESILENCCTP